LILATALVLVVVLQSLGYNPIRALLKRVPYINILVVDEDPLGIVGKWTYTTSFNTEEDAKKHRYKQVRGVNFLINFDGCRYAMQGQRTGYVEKNSDGQFKDYPTPLSIKMSHSGFTSNPGSLFFFFEVQGDEESKGYVELQVQKPNQSIMDGFVHYLHTDPDRTWSVAQIHFERQ